MSISRHQATGAYRLWTPPDFDAPKTDADAAAEASEESAQIETSSPAEEDLQPVVETQAEAEPEAAPPPEPTVKLPTAEEIEAMFEQTRSDGYRAGQEEGLTAAREEAAQLARLVAAMDESFDQLGTEVADEIVALAIVLAERMVGDTLATHPEAVAATVRDALQHAPPQGKIRIHLHPQDVQLVREHLGEQLEAGHHHLIEDESVTRGGCHLKTAHSDVDATLETRWQRVLEGIGRFSGDDDA